MPPISNAESNAQGTATITFSVPRDASGNVTGEGDWNVQAVVSGFTRHQHDQAAHIHNGPVGVNANIFVDTKLLAANAIPLPGGAATINFEQVQILQSQARPSEQPGRPLLQHAHPTESRRRDPRAVGQG